MTPPVLRVLVYGAGAVGTYLGGSLALSGNQVVFLARPESAKRLRKSGLRLSLQDTTHHISKAQIAASLEAALAVGPFDIALFAPKSYDTKAALGEISPYAEAMPPILCLQNGVENEAALAETLGADKVIAGTLTTAVGKRGPGDAQLERLRGVGLAADHPLSARLATEFNRAGLQAQLYTNPAAMKWSKLLTNLLANASSAILDMSPKEIFAHADLHRLEVRQLREALAVMDAQGLKVVDLPSTPVRALAFAVRYLPPAISRPLFQRAVGRGRGLKMPSFHIDLHSGKGRSEVDWLNGAVVKAGEKLGVPTPVNGLLRDTLQALTSGGVSLEAFARQPIRLLNADRNTDVRLN